MHKIVFLIVTFFGIGKIKCAPGTFGSIAAFPLIYALMHFVAAWNVNFFPHINTLTTLEQQILSLLLLLVLVTLFLFIIGVVASNIYMQGTGVHDPKEIVVDEVVGQILVVALSLFTLPIAHYSGLADILSPIIIDWLYLAILPFVFFRIYDIIKPWPINWMDQNIDGGLGVMLDDIAAALFATVTHYALLFVVIDIVNG